MDREPRLETNLNRIKMVHCLHLVLILDVLCRRNYWVLEHSYDRKRPAA
jgi:hypothetical protein